MFVPNLCIGIFGGSSWDDVKARVFNHLLFELILKLKGVLNKLGGYHFRGVFNIKAQPEAP